MDKAKYTQREEEEKVVLTLIVQKERLLNQISKNYDNEF